MIIAPRNSGGAWYFFEKGNFPALRRRMELLYSIGARFVRFWIPWSEVEREEGRFDFSYVNDAIATIAVTGLRLDITLCSLMAPDWFWAKPPDARPLNENGEPVYKPDPKSVGSASISLWHPELRPRTETFLRRALSECLDRWAPLILFLRMSMGRFNEPTYPDCRHFWCYDRWARADFRVQMEAKYGGEISDLNRAWGTGYRDFGEVDPPRPAGFKTLTAACRADFIDWYRDAKDTAVLWTIQTLQSRLKPWQRIVVFAAGADDADAHREDFVQKARVRPALKQMARNFWLVEKCREMGLYAQYAGLGLEVNRAFLGELSARCRAAGVPLYGQIAGLRSKSDAAANRPEAIADLIAEFGLHGLAWNKDADVFYPPAQPNEKFNRLREAYDLIARHHREAVSHPVLTSINHALKPAGARIEWQTDRKCDGVVLYGTRRGFPGRTSSYDAMFGPEHAVELTKLKKGVPYYYIVSSMDRSGRATCGRERTFTL